MLNGAIIDNSVAKMVRFRERDLLRPTSKPVMRAYEPMLCTAAGSGVSQYSFHFIINLAIFSKVSP